MSAGKASILYIGNKLSAHGRTPGNIDTLGPLLEKEGYTVYYSSTKLNKLLRLLDMSGSIWHYRKTVDVVLIDTFSTSAFYFAWLCARWCSILGLKYIPILRGGNLPQRLQQSPGKCRQLFGKSFQNIAVSQYLHLELQRMGLDSIVIENHIELKEYSFRERSDLKPALLWVRAFHKTYNPQMAVMLVKQLRNQYPDIHLTMVGPELDGSMKACGELCTEYGLQQHVTFTGKLTKRQWSGLAHHSDIFINTTNFDNLPVSVIEAMALGLPVVSTNVGGIPYLLKDGQDSILVNKGDVHAMQKAVVELLENNKLAHKLSVNAREHALQFDWSIIKLKWQHLLKELTK